MRTFYLIILAILFFTRIIGSIVMYLSGALAFANQFNSKSEITMPVEFWFYIGFVSLAVISLLFIWAITVLWEVAEDKHQDSIDKMMKEYERHNPWNHND